MSGKQEYPNEGFALMRNLHRLDARRALEELNSNSEDAKEKEGHLVRDSEKVSQEAKQIFTSARGEAKRLNHNYLGSEHLLLGLMRDSSVREVFKKLDIDPENIKEHLEFIIGPGPKKPIAELKIAPRVEEIVELALDESQLGGSMKITPIDLLIGVVREGEGVAAGIIESKAIDTYNLPAKIRSIRSQIHRGNKG